MNKTSFSFATTLTTLVLLLALISNAQASKPETPTLNVGEVSYTSAVLSGILNPGATGPREAGTYQFVYRATETGDCKGPGEEVTPGVPALSSGMEDEQLLPEFIAGLTPATVYAACLTASETGRTEPAVSASVIFKTKIPLEEPQTTAPTAVTSDSATFTGIVNPNNPGEEGEKYKFFYQAESNECHGENEIAVPEVALPATEEKDQIVSVQVNELKPKTLYTYCAWVRNEEFESATGSSVTFETPTAIPSISLPGVEDVSATGAVINAKVSPGGSVTTFTISGAGIVATGKTLPAATYPVSVQQRLTGLSSGTTYVVHLSATNEQGTTESEVTFTTGSQASQEIVVSECPNKQSVGFQVSLPDCRAAELVSSEHEVGEVYVPGGEVGGHEEDIDTARPFRAAADGEKVAYLADAGLTGGDGSMAKGRGNEYLARRSAEGWTTVNITPSVGEGETASAERKYRSFSSELNTGIVESERPLLGAHPSPQGPEDCSVLYEVGLSGGSATFGSLFTETLTPGFCGYPEESAGRDASLMFAGESADNSIKVFESPAALTAPASETSEMGGNVYATTTAGELHVVNVLPDGSVEPAAVVGAPSELSGNGPDLSDAISSNGGRIFWSSITPEESTYGQAAFPQALYAREEPLSPSARTVQLDAATANAPGPSGGGQFWGASADGSDVFFTDCHKLTVESTANEEDGCHHPDEGKTGVIKTGADLYEYDFAAPANERLEDLTVDPDASDPLGADVQGVIGTSETGDYVYFVAGGALGASPNSQGEVPEPGKCEQAPVTTTERAEELAGEVPAGYGCNIFELHYDGQRWETPKFIARVAAIDDAASSSPINAPGGGGLGDEVVGDWNPNLGSRTAEVTPDGQDVVFGSTQDLTGYDVSIAGTALGTHSQGGNEIFRYEAAANTLTCVSCDPENKPPDVKAIQLNYSTYLPVSSSSTFMHRWINDEGTEIFFDTSQALSNKDTNGTQDVYEWDAQGTPSCPVSTSSYGGCISLLSGGESSAFSFLVDTDSSGTNVFVVHRGPLYGVGPSGTKSALYDLRAYGGAVRRSGEGCDSVATCPASPVLVSTEGSLPGSSQVSGSDNFKPVTRVKQKTSAQLRAEHLAQAVKKCDRLHRRSRKKRQVCVRAAQRKYKAAVKAPAKRSSKRS